MPVQCDKLKAKNLKETSLRTPNTFVFCPEILPGFSENTGDWPSDDYSRKSYPEVHTDAP